METQTKTFFFTRDISFYKTFFGMLLMVVLQNLVAYSINMADNIMLGSYDQDSLSGAATVNQLFFLVQQFALSIGNALIVLASQYWGKKRTSPIRILTGIALKWSLVCSLFIVCICNFFSEPLLSLFTDSPYIISEGRTYLSLVQWTFALYILTNVLMAALRSVKTVKISFIISIFSLFVNILINYTLIYGHFGFPEMGIKGAAIGTLISRILEFLIVLIYIWKIDKKLNLFSRELLVTNSVLSRDYTKVCIPIMVSSVLWGISVPMQTAILGHLSEDAIAANSVATTFYQYLKVIVIAISSTASVMIGNSIGRGQEEQIRSDARTLSAIAVFVGILLGAAMILLRHPLLSMYQLTESATTMAKNLIIIMGFIMVGMSYQMPTSSGIIQGGGDTGFTLKTNMISTWLIVMPLSFLAAFRWKWPVEAVVLVIQSDQIFKGLPTFLRFRSYKWIKKLTK